jgi:NAD(P)-dependent dehydrogenase (short-subunit alcohol dehydrogenase family)
MPSLTGTTALVTGANRGIGLAFAQALVDAGAAKVYAAARDPRTITDPRLTPIALDVTDPTQIAQAARTLTDVDLVINNAGIGDRSTPLTADLDQARRELEVNYLAPIAIAQAFAPVLKANGGGTLVNMLSVVSFVTAPHLATYSGSKAAAWNITNALRIELRAQGTRVVGVHVGYVDTDLTAQLVGDKLPATAVSAALIAGLEAGDEEILVDDLSRAVKAGLSDDHHLVLPRIQEQFDAARAAVR